MEDFKNEIMNLQRQLAVVTEERDKLKVSLILVSSWNSSCASISWSKNSTSTNTFYDNSSTALIFRVFLCYFQRNQAEQVSLNKLLMGEVTEIQKEAALVQEIPQRLCESVANCKDIYKDVLLTLEVT